MVIQLSLIVTEMKMADTLGKSFHQFFQAPSPPIVDVGVAGIQGQH
jgi:hypothetical protein